MENDYRMDISPEQGKPAFTEEHVARIRKTLNEHFEGCQPVDGDQNWDSYIEKIRSFRLPKLHAKLNMPAGLPQDFINAARLFSNEFFKQFPNALVVLVHNGKKTAFYPPGGDPGKLKPLPGRLPERTQALKSLEERLAGLNDIYWLLRAATQDFTSRGNSDADKLASYVNASVLNKLDITRGDLKQTSEDIGLRMRHMMIANAVSYHEDYLATVLEEFFIISPKPEKLINIEIRLSEIGANGLSEAELKQKAAKTVISEIIGSKYKDRFTKIAKLLSELNGRDVRAYWNNDRLGAAQFEVRNCIIHCAGVADDRAVTELKWLFPSIKLGDQLPIDEGKLWDLLGALRDVARAIDATIRMG